MQAEMCFYTPGNSERVVPSIIDVARTNDKGETVTYFHGETLEALRQRYPSALLAPVAYVVELKENALKSDPIQITEEQFIDALEVLPPLDWVRKGGGESFKMVERYSGRITTIYARQGTSYWCFNDVDTLPHSEIMAKVAAVVKQEATV